MLNKYSHNYLGWLCSTLFCLHLAFAGAISLVRIYISQWSVVVIRPVVSGRN